MFLYIITDCSKSSDSVCEASLLNGQVTGQMSPASSIQNCLSRYSYVQYVMAWSVAYFLESPSQVETLKLREEGDEKGHLVEDWM